MQENRELLGCSPEEKLSADFGLSSSWGGSPGPYPGCNAAASAQTLPGLNRKAPSQHTTDTDPWIMGGVASVGVFWGWSKCTGTTCGRG